MKSVLISELNSTDQRTFLPYVWGTLRAYCQKNYPRVNEAIHWHDPLYECYSAREAYQACQHLELDVLGISCYTWNSERQYELAALVKESRPECLVVAGGPEPDYKSDRFFEENPFIDLVVIADGEIPFAMILKKIVAGERSFRDVPGVMLPNLMGKPAMLSVPEKLVDFPPSPFLEFSDYYDSIIRNKARRACVTWETNRGCPYKCSFCDWGSNTLSKVRKIDMDRIVAEAEWIFQRRFGLVFIADANFGIFSRDLEIAKLLTDFSKGAEGPQYCYYSLAKNNPARNGDIALELKRADLSSILYVSLQHTDIEVLEATDRTNISVEQQKKLVSEMLLQGVPVAAQLILGIPGDTRDKWEQVFSDLMEWGIHDEYVVSDYVVLPNAPVADRAFRDKWRYKTIKRFTRDLGLARSKNLGKKGCFQVHMIVESSTFTRQDWIQMRLYSEFVIALHNTGYTRRIAQYLRTSKGIPYREFYNLIINDFCRNALLDGKWWSFIREVLEIFMTDDNAIDDVDMAELPGLPVYVKLNDWISAKIGLESKAFYSQLKSYLLSRLFEVKNLASVVDYQRNLIITPEYQISAGRRFETEHDWPTYFSHLDSLNGVAAPTEPEHFPREEVLHIIDRFTGTFNHISLDWDHGSDNHLLKWAQRVPLSRKSMDTQCFDAPVRSGSPGILTLA